MDISFTYCVTYVMMDVLCLVLTLIISGNVSRDSGSERQVRFFFLLLTANEFFVIFDSVWAVVTSSGYFHPDVFTLTVLNTVTLTAIAFAGYFWFCFCLAFFESRLTNNTRFIVSAAFIICLVPLFEVIGYVAGSGVVVSPDGRISYGIMHALSASMSVPYMLAATVVAAYRFRIAKTKPERRMSLVFIMFTLPPAIAFMVDAMIPNTPVASAGIIVALVFVMMSMQEARISCDALTGLNNRRRSDAYLEDMVLRATADKPVYLFIIDMDHFKHINDTYGHLEGDHALQLMAKTLRIVCSQVGTFAGRWGGDEFVMIGAVPEPLTPDSVALMVQETLAEQVPESQAKYQLECSVGYASCPTAQDARELVAQADEMLYHVKSGRR